MNCDEVQYNNGWNEFSMQRWEGSTIYCPSIRIYEYTYKYVDHCSLISISLFQASLSPTPDPALQAPSQALS